MASAITFNGRRITRPGVYSKMDASELAGVSPAATGIVALIGTAEGGKPLTIESTFSDLTSPEAGLTRYRSGDLRIATQFAFQPSLDDAVPGGAQRIVAVKVNPATQSEITLVDSLAAPSVDLTSVDYGLFTAQINVDVDAGTLQGKKITILFEDTEEIIDNVGGDAIFSLDYTPGADGYDTMLATLSASSLTVLATKAEVGLDTERSADIAAPGVLQYLSSAAGDTTQTVRVFGLDGANLPVSETVTLTGTVAVTGTQTFSTVLGALKSAATVGTITVRSTVPTTLFSLAPATLTRGLVTVTAGMAQGVVTVDLDSASAGARLAIFGTSATGASTAGAYDVSAGTPVVGTVTFGTLSYLALGDIPAARTATFSLTATQTLHSTYRTVQKVVDRLNAISGWTASALVSNPTTFLMADADYVSSVSVLVAASFYANLTAFVEAINTNSSLITAARSTGATSVPADTSAVYLAGGIEGAVSAAEWAAAFTLLKQRRVNIIVPLTRDPAVHSLLALHLVERAGKLRSEANGYAAIGTADGAGETRTNVKSQIQALRTRHVSAVSQEIERFDPDTLEATWYPPYMLAAIAAGMQAGTSVGEPLTNKVPLVTDVRQDSTWTTQDDTDEMIDAGLMFLEKVDGAGIAFVRSITTHLADDNPVFTEMSANAAANEAVYRLRRVLQQRIGRRGLATSIGALKGIAVDELNKLADPVEGVIVSWRNLTIEQVGDVFPISVELAPVQPINFIPVTVHLVAARAVA
ncbi:MAG: hypothetical protein M3Q55_15325 [Acidobacteriota bacterium]|nr:hypothetical protein [Acidobacteriota bacterium]